MTNEIVKQFLRDVAEIPTHKTLNRFKRDPYGKLVVEAYAEERVPEWFEKLVDAAKKAVAAIDQQKGGKE